MTETASRKNRLTIPVLISVAGFLLMKVIQKTGILNGIMSQSAAVWIQMIMYIVLGGLAIYAFRDDFKEAGREWKEHKVRSLLWLAGSLLAGYIVQILGALPVYLLYPDYESVNDTSVGAAAAVVPAFVSILVIGIMGPLTEEAFFRFFGVKRLSSVVPAWLCIIVSSVAFGIMHVKVFTLAELLYYLPTVMQAAVWAFAVHKSKNITISLIDHLMINLPAIVIMYLSGAV